MDQSFLLAITVYVAVPSLMVFGALVLPAAVTRTIDLALSCAYALTIIAGSIGEWTYYVVGSVIEVTLLVAIGYYAWTWPKRVQPVPAIGHTPTGAVDESPALHAS